MNGILLRDFNLKTDLANGINKTITGTIAQELLQYPQYKNLVLNDSNNYYLVQEISSWKIVKGIQELSKENEELKNDNLAMKKSLCEIGAKEWC